MRKEDRDEFREILNDTFKPLAHNVGKLGEKVETQGKEFVELRTQVKDKFDNMGNCSENVTRIKQNEDEVDKLHKRANKLSNRLWGIIISGAGVAILLVIWFIKVFYRG